MKDDAARAAEMDRSKWDFRDPEVFVYKSERGLSRETVEDISRHKGEPQWMLEARLRAYEVFLKKPMPRWGGDLSGVNFDDYTYYIKPTDKREDAWEDVPENIRKTFDKLGVPEAERKFLAGVGAQYECLTGDTRVYTARGAVPMKEIKAGDTVFSLDEETSRIVPAPVKAFMSKGRRKVYELKVGTRSIKATGNHPFLVLEHRRKEGGTRGRYARTWKYLRDLKAGDLVAVAKSVPDVGRAHKLERPAVEINWRHNNVQLPKATSVDLMWWLGLYVGDGFIHGEDKKARVELAIPQTEPALRQELKRVTQRLFNAEARNGDPFRLTIGSTVLARYLEANGFKGGALEKRVPSWVAALPHEQIEAFIGGYVDADGYVRDHAKNKDVALTSANPGLLQDVRDLAASCGISTSNIHRFEGRHPHDEDRTMAGYRMAFSGDFDRLGCRSEQRLGRMNRRKFHHDQSMAAGTSFRSHVNEFMGYARISSIEPAGTENVYDIEVDGPHNFVAEGLIVHNSEMVYHSINQELQKKGVIFVDTDTGLREHPDLFKRYFGTLVPPEDNKLAALNTACWSGGSFIYVPKGVVLPMPLQAYFRINSENMGQFERTIIIADEGAQLHYIEGCTAPQYSTKSLHTGVIEIFVHKGAKVRYTTIQNWAHNIYNLVTQRAVAYENATMEWVDGNLGSKLTMKYPSIYLMGEGARGNVLSVAFASDGQHQDAGTKIIHKAKNTASTILSKSISKGSGRSSFRGLVKVAKGATGVKASVKCDALMLDEKSRSDTYPTMEIAEEDVAVGHEATVGKISDEELFYLQSRGLSEADATAMIVQGFISPFVKELPMEYAVEMNRLIALEMEGAVG